jgi:hypothetical protein
MPDLFDEIDGKKEVNRRNTTAKFNKYRIIKTPNGYMAQRKYGWFWLNAFEMLSEEPVYFNSAEEAEQQLIKCGAFEDQVTKVVKEF